MKCELCMGKACPSPGKHPAHTKWKIYQDKKADEHTLDMWFKSRFEKYNIGVVTGKVSNTYLLSMSMLARAKMGTIV